jgi:hypothetical protein
MDGIDYPAPPPSRTDNAILPQVSAESYKKGGSLSQGFSLALPSGRARLPSNKRETPARLRGGLRVPIESLGVRAGRASPAYPSGASLKRCSTPLHRTGYERYSPSFREGGCSRKHSPLLFAHYQYRAVSVTDNRIGNASHEGPSYPTVATAPHYYQPGAYLVS